MGKIKLGDYKNAKINKVLNQIDRDFPKAARRVLKDVNHDLTSMYKTLIEQFYKYKTKSYVRHWEGVPGTQEGQNLYFGLNIKEDFYHDNPKLFVNIDSSNEEMADDYALDSADHVLDMILNGIRFPYTVKQVRSTKIGEGGRWKNIYAGSPMFVDKSDFHYQGKFINFSNGTIGDAFKQFKGDWQKTSSNAFYSIWDEYVDKWEY